jgi:hypothetical protein
LFSSLFIHKNKVADIINTFSIETAIFDVDILIFTSSKFTVRITISSLWSYQQFVKKVRSILSLSTLTLISGFPVSTDNFTPVVLGFYLVLLSSFCKTIALSKLVPVN